ncbi:DsbC family protein [Halomonas campaniensis]|uniref:DsbC family protein n=1 Tax=Halomonas campaniensis TaxID=213554 RepID=UPI000B53432C|nr:DsbC family protein [Halomonas campaniensis]
MTWKATFSGRYDDIYHLVGDESFAIKDGKIIFSNGTSIAFIEKGNDADNRIVQGETTRLLKTIKKAKRKHHLIKAIKWGATGCFLIVSLFVINGALVSQGNNIYSPNLGEIGNSMLESPPSSNNGIGATTQPFTEQQNALPQPQPASQASKDELASGIKQGVERGVTVRLGPNEAENTLYVFADPLCPYCQQLEPTLHELADLGIRVEIFPVSVIGKDQSLPLASSSLCQSDAEERAHVWKTAASGDPVLDANACESGDTAVNLNNQFFQAAGFAGTPTLLNAKGEQPPRSVSRDTESIREWLSS